MTATTQSRDTERSDGMLKMMKAGAEFIPKGVLACINATGYAINGTDSANCLFAGVTYESIDNSTGSAGDLSLRIEKTGEHTFYYAGGNASQSIVGMEAYLVDNQTVDEDSLIVTNDIKCGIIAEVISANSVRIRIDGYAK